MRRVSFRRGVNRSERITMCHIVDTTIIVLYFVYLMHREEDTFTLFSHFQKDTGDG